MVNEELKHHQCFDKKMQISSGQSNKKRSSISQYKTTEKRLQYPSLFFLRNVCVIANLATFCSKIIDSHICAACSSRSEEPRKNVRRTSFVKIAFLRTSKQQRKKSFEFLDLNKRWSTGHIFAAVVSSLTEKKHSMRKKKLETFQYVGHPFLFRAGEKFFRILLILRRRTKKSGSRRGKGFPSIFSLNPGSNDGRLFHDPKGSQKWASKTSSYSFPSHE